MKTRIEVTFTSGKFIAFPDVHEYEVLEKDGTRTLKVRHSDSDDIAYVSMEKVDFMEIMKR
jgi:hypothetical protein